MRKLCAIAGILALSSLTFYGFTGMALWAPITGPEDGRVGVLVVLHYFGIAAGVCAGIGSLWKKREE